MKKIANITSAVELSSNTHPLEQFLKTLVIFIHLICYDIMSYRLVIKSGDEKQDQINGRYMYIVLLLSDQFIYQRANTTQ